MKPPSNTSSRFNPWPVGLVVYFICFIGATAAFIAFSLRHNSDLVAPDYYAQELRYQEQVDRLNRTRAEQVKVQAVLSRDGTRLTLRLPGLTGKADGEIHFYRPSAAALDRRTPLALEAGGVQTLDVSDLAPGLWRLRVRWSANQQEYYDETPVVIRRPEGGTASTP